MISCKECPDKMQCVTDNIDKCRRGFRLSKCCREYLVGRKKYILKLILNMPEEMVKNNKIEVNEVCGSCGEKLTISLNIFSVTNTLNNELWSGTFTDISFPSEIDHKQLLKAKNELNQIQSKPKKKEDKAWDL